MSEEQEICWSIGLFYLEKNDHHKDDAIAEILKLGIVNVRLNKEVPIENFQLGWEPNNEDKIQLKKIEVEITLNRPGQLIGKKGENINRLTKFLQEKNNISHIRIVEEVEKYNPVMNNLLAPCY